MNEEERKEREEQIFKAAISKTSMLCPRCARRYITPGTTAADEYGVCVSCLYDARATAIEQAAQEVIAHREYERRRKAAQRERGEAVGNRSKNKYEPIF